MMNKRGIIISPTNNISVAGSESIDPTYLRHCLLYWDIIDCPNDRLLKVNLDKNIKDIELLQKEGILIRTEGFFFAKKSPHYKMILSMHADHPIEFWALAQLYAFKKYCESGQLFSIGQINHNLIFNEICSNEAFFFVETPPFDNNQTSNVFKLTPEKTYSAKDALEKGPVVELDLYQAIPVPLSDVPMEAILKFKQDRRAELLRFRHAMDAFYRKIIDDRDIPRAKTAAIEEIELSLLELTKVMNESRWAIIKANTDISADLKVEGTIGLRGGTFKVTPSFKISVKPEAFRPKQIPDNLNDFAYLYYAKEELRR
jgi:hypothetical protein